MWINRELLGIKVHYFLRYAGSAYLVMLLPLMVRSKGLSTQVVGLLWSVLPVVGLITNSISGTLADYLKVHRVVFLGSLIFLTAGSTSIYWIPKLSSSGDALEAVNGFSSSPNVSLHLGTTSDTNTTSLKASMLRLHESLVDPEMTVGEGQITSSHLSSPMEESESGTLASLMTYPQFWLIALALLVEQIGLSTCVMMSDAVCFQILGSERHKYGHQRLWGTLGMGLMSVILGGLIDIYSQGLPEKDYLPSVIACIVLMLCDIMVVARMRIPNAADDRFKFGDVGSSLVRPEVFLFLVTVYVMGTSLGIMWVFKLMLVEDVALTWDPQFPALKLLLGLDLGIETFVGEMPFFFLSGRIIKHLGYICVLAISVTAIGARFCLYYTVSNPWWFLPIELLNGLSYSLFQSSMVSYASCIAPPGAQATLQSIVRTSFSSGLSTAGFLGGYLFNTMGGSFAFLQVGIFDLMYVVIFALLHSLINKYCSQSSITDDTTCKFPEGGVATKKESAVSHTAVEAKELLMVEMHKGRSGSVTLISGSQKELAEDRTRFLV